MPALRFGVVSAPAARPTGPAVAAPLPAAPPFGGADAGTRQRKRAATAASANVRIAFSEIITTPLLHSLGLQASKRKTRDRASSEAAQAQAVRDDRDGREPH